MLDLLNSENAAKFLNITIDEFKKYEEKSQIAYILYNGERKYLEINLNQFKKEVLLKQKKR